jgi:hypothetical protein
LGETVINLGETVFNLGECVTKWGKQAEHICSSNVCLVAVESHFDAGCLLRADGCAIETTAVNIPSRYLFPALLRANRTDLIVEMATQTTMPSLGYQVAQGATTLWEDYSGVGDLSNGGYGTAPSHNHHFMGGMGQFFWDGFVGLRQGTGTAYAHMVVHPQLTQHPTLLGWANASVATPRGQVAVAWAVDQDGVVRLNCTIPPNAQATVIVPTSGPAPASSVYESGSLVWTGGRAVRKMAAAAATVGKAAFEPTRASAPVAYRALAVQSRLDGVEFVVGSGSFLWESRPNLPQSKLAL